MRLPGRESRWSEPAQDRLEPLVDALDSAASSLLDRPFVLFGHSYGAVVVFEWARQRAARGASAPLRVVLSGAGAPVPGEDPRLRELDDDDLLAALEQRGAALGLLADASLRELVLPAIRADVSAYETYAPPPSARLESPVTVLWARDDPSVDRERAQAWQQSCPELELLEIDGGHMFIATRRTEILRLLSTRLRSSVR